MAEHIEIPSGALQGNWVSDQEPVEPSGSAAFCMEALRKLINGDDVWLYNPERKHSVLDSRPQNSASIFVNTGGTSGIPRFARHTWGTMSAAVAALQGVLDNEPIYSWCCLPIWHVAGWMQVVRAIQTNGDLAFGDYRDLADPQKDINLTGRLISLVPTQLHRLIFSDLAVSLVAQYDIAGSIIVAYIKIPIIRPHVPYSCTVRVLVIIRLNINPVSIVIIPTLNEINPE